MSSFSSGLREILDIICENVAFEWKSFAREIGLSLSEINEIEGSYIDTHTQCLHTIGQWRRNNSRARLRDLVAALRKCRLGRVAGEMPSRVKENLLFPPNFLLGRTYMPSYSRLFSTPLKFRHLQDIFHSCECTVDRNIWWGKWKCLTSEMFDNIPITVPNDIFIIGRKFQH